MKIKNFFYNKSLIFGVKVLVSLVALFFLFYNVDKKAILDSFLHASISFVVLSFILKILGIVFSSMVLLECVNFFGLEVRFKFLLETYFSSYFFNNFGLGNLGGDSFKGFRIHGVTKKKLATVGSLLLEKIIGAMVLASFIIFGAVIYFLGISVYIAFLSLFLSFLVLLISLYSLHYFANLSLIVRIIKIKFPQINPLNLVSFTPSQKMFLFRSIFFSFLFYVCTILSFASVIASVDTTIPLRVSFIVLPLIFILNSLPISFQGLGIREVSISFLFSYLGYSFNAGVTVASIMLIINLLISLMSGIFYFIVLFMKR